MTRASRLVNFFEKNTAFIFATCILFVAAWLFLKRVVFPDLAFDTINYHFLIGKAGLDNFPAPFQSAEFFPMGMHSFNPLADVITQLFYRVAGYRFGTLPSFLFLVLLVLLAVSITNLVMVEKFSFWAKLFIFPAIVVNESLFQTATYFTDNFYAALVLLFFYLSLRFPIRSRKNLTTFLMILGFAAGLLLTKLTNIIYLIPLSLLIIFIIISKKIYVDGGRQITFDASSSILVYLLPLFAVVGYHFYFTFLETGNPVFPFYNSIFKSTYYPVISWEFNMGPKSVYERLFYPYYVFSNPVLLGEVKDMFPDLKLIYGVIASVICFIVLKLKATVFSRNELSLIFVTYCSYVLWQGLFGYSRYAIALEIFVGLTLVVFANKVFLMPRNLTLKLISIFILVFFSYQSLKILQFNAVYDIAWRPNVDFTEWRKRIVVPELFNKYTVVDSKTSSLLKEVEAVVQCANPSSAYAMTIPELMNKPFLNFDIGSNGAMTLNKAYVKERDRRFNLERSSRARDYISFAIIFNNTNPGMKQREICLKAIEEQVINGRELTISKELLVDNFVGDKRQALTVFLGTYRPTGSF